MLKEESVLKELEEIMKCNNCFEENDFYGANTSVSDGSSYDGFINFTDGFIDIISPYVPHQDTELTFKGGDDEAQKKRAKNAQLILDGLLATDITGFYQDNKDDLESEFPTFDEFKEWYDSYEPYQKDPTPSLFEEGVHYDLDPKHDKLYEQVSEYDRDYYFESPAFIGVQLKLYDNDNWRNDLHNGKHLARLESFFNDDLGYGRERVGSWARTMGMVSADGSDIGNHLIYLDEFGYDTFDELKEKLKSKIGDAYKSLGLYL